MPTMDGLWPSGCDLCHFPAWPCGRKVDCLYTTVKWRPPSAMLREATCVGRFPSRIHPTRTPMKKRHARKHAARNKNVAIWNSAGNQFPAQTHCRAFRVP